MSVNDEIRRTLSDPKPFYALAGVGDYAAEKLKDAPALLTEVADTVTNLANRIAAEAPERLAAVRSLLGDTQINLVSIDLKNLDPKAARDNFREAVGKADVQALRDRAQTVALIQVGRALEVAGKAVETYDELAERGKTVIGRYRGQSETEPAAEHVTVVVEQVVADAVDEAPVRGSKTGDGETVVIEDALITEPGSESEPRTEAAAKTPPTPKAAPRKRAAAPKAPKQSPR
jgi:heparin binding hemagglutinin HbhA